MTAGPLRPEFGEGTALGQTTGMWTNSVGNGSVESWGSTQWTGGDHFQFMVDGTGRDFFDITWSHISSSTGPRDFSLSYSLDGVKFVWMADYQVMANATPNNGSYSAPVADSRYGMEIQFYQARKGPIYFRITSVSGVAASGGSLAIGGPGGWTIASSRPRCGRRTAGGARKRVAVF